MTLPDYKYLLEVNKNTKKLYKDKSGIFHSVTVKLIFLTKIEISDLDTAVSFLTMIVKKSDEDGCNKIRRVLVWIKSAIYYKRIIGTSSLKDVYMWINAEYMLHPNMRGRTGGKNSFVTEITHSEYSKYKLNAKISTEAEPLGMSQYSPYKIWIMIFLEE